MTRDSSRRKRGAYLQRNRLDGSGGASDDFFEVVAVPSASAHGTHPNSLSDRAIHRSGVSACADNVARQATFIAQKPTQEILMFAAPKADLDEIVRTSNLGSKAEFWSRYSALAAWRGSRKAEKWDRKQGATDPDMGISSKRSPINPTLARAGIPHLFKRLPWAYLPGTLILAFASGRRTEESRHRVSGLGG
jgi:hypothetical protein